VERDHSHRSRFLVCARESPGKIHNMTEIEFTAYIDAVCNYYERRRPKDATCDLWYTRVKGIPAEPLEWIFAKLTQSDEVPKNLPGRTWQLYKEWLISHSEKALFPTTFDCPECKDVPGLLYVTAASPKTGLKMFYVFNCARCRQSPYKGWPYSLKKDLLEAGYTMVDLHEGTRHFPRDIKKLADNVVKIFPK